MKDRKGFTLTELLVVIVILGIITGISIPLIRNLSSTFEKKKYTNYRDSMLTAGKLYNDSYSEDLFGHNEYGCSYITYEQLVERNLLKDIEVADVSCNSDKTYIRVVKQKDKYGYVPFLSCGKDVNGTASNVTVSLPEVIPEMDTTSCAGADADGGILTISADMSQSGAVADKNRKKTKVTITSYTGISNNIVIYTKWSQNRNDQNNSGFVKTDFKVKGNQEATLLAGNPITSTSKELVTPEGGEGAWYLIVRVDHLQDLYGSKWKNPNNTDSKFVSFGPFTVDNTPPTIVANIYKCDANSNKTGSVIASRSDLNNGVYSISNISGNVNGWLSNVNYANGVCFEFKLSDNSIVRSTEWQWNTSGQKENASGYKTLTGGPTINKYTTNSSSQTYNNYLAATGHRYARLTVKDAAGNKTTIDIDAKIDRTNPNKPTITNSSNEQWTKDDITLTMGSSDYMSGMGKYYYTYNANATQYGPGTESGTKWVELPEGQNKTSFGAVWNREYNTTVYIKSCDNAGNCSDKNSTALKIDRTPPVPPRIANSSNGQWTKDNITLTMGSLDEGSGIGKYYYTYNADATQYGPGTESGTKWVELTKGRDKESFSDVWDQAYNNKTVYIKACDKVGNCSNKNSTSLKIDRTAPTCGTATGTSTSWTNSDRTISQECSDTGGSGCVQAAYNKTYSTTTKTDTITIKDNAGNTNTCTYNVYIDKTPPTTPTISSPYENTWVNFDFDMTISSSDAHSGLSNYQYTYNGNASWVSGDAESQWAIEQYTSSNSYVSTFSAERNQNVYWRTCDNAGNCSGVSSSRVKIDKTGPSYSTSYPNPSSYGVDFSASCWDSGSGCTNSSIWDDNLTSNQWYKFEDYAGNVTWVEADVSTRTDCYDWEVYDYRSNSQACPSSYGSWQYNVTSCAPGTVGFDVCTRCKEFCANGSNSNCTYRCCVRRECWTVYY